MSTAYHVYMNSGVGDLIAYNAPIAVVELATSLAIPSLTASGDYWFGVRAFDTGTGLEEQNIDCVVQIVLDKNGNDVTNKPLPPVAVRAFAVKGGNIKVEWSYFPSLRAGDPLGFHVYAGPGTTPSYNAPVSTVLYSDGIANSFSTVLTGLTDGISYAIGVRSYNQSAEEINGNVVTAVAKTTGPMAVVGLSAVATV